MAAINVTKIDAQTVNSKMEKLDDSNATTTHNTTSAATTATTTSKTSEMKQDSESKSDPKSSKKVNKYSEFTSIYGFYCSYNRRIDSLHSRHNSLEEANRAVKSFLENTKRQYPDMYTSIYNHSPFEAFASFDISGITYFSVKEIEITKCHLDELKVIARRENVSVTRKSKKQLLAILEPIIYHKKHQNRGEDIDIKHCKQCQSEHVEEYMKYQRERANDPMVKEQKSMRQMYRGSLVNALTENKVKRQYGLTFEDLREGIVSEQAETTETAKSQKKSQKKRGREVLEADIESVSVPKKRKLNHIRNSREVDCAGTQSEVQRLLR